VTSFNEYPDIRIYKYIYIYIYRERERQANRQIERQTETVSLFDALYTWVWPRGINYLSLPYNPGSLMTGFCKLVAKFSLSLNSPIDWRFR